MKEKQLLVDAVVTSQHTLVKVFSCLDGSSQFQAQFDDCRFFLPCEEVSEDESLCVSENVARFNLKDFSLAESNIGRIEKRGRIRSNPPCDFDNMVFLGSVHVCSYWICVLDREDDLMIYDSSGKRHYQHTMEGRGRCLQSGGIFNGAKDEFIYFNQFSLKIFW